MSTQNSIAKNTLFLYVRMLLSLTVSLYTARVVLDVLGVDDYGIYIAVGGIAGFMSFVNSALGNASTRFIMFALGKDDRLNMEKTFSTSLTVHIILAFLIVVLGETVGLWFLHHKMVIPVERMSAAIWVYHVSIITAFFTITQVPFTATINAHEHMSVYAFASIIESILKLTIVFLLTVFQYDKLIVYSLLYFAVTLFMLMFYRFYCQRHFFETHYKPRLYDRNVFKEISVFSGWSLLNSSGIAFIGQGVLLLLNMFFAPAVVSARAISLQVNGLAMQFSNNFKAAANPQIVKRYANNEEDSAKSLVLKTAKYSCFLMWFLALPICLLASPLLHVWLKIVPPYTVLFIQFVAIQSLFSTLQSSLFMAFYAKGRLKINTILTTLIYFIQFIVVYILFELGYSPISLSIASLLTDVLLGVVLQPILLNRMLGYSLPDLLQVFIPCVKISFFSAILPLILYCLVDVHTIIGFFIIGFSCVVSISLTVWTYGLEEEIRVKISEKIRNLVYGYIHK